MAKEINVKNKTDKANNPRDVNTAYHEKHSKEHVKVSGGGCLIPVV